MQAALWPNLASVQPYSTLHRESRAHTKQLRKTLQRAATQETSLLCTSYPAAAPVSLPQKWRHQHIFSGNSSRRNHSSGRISAYQLEACQLTSTNRRAGQGLGLCPSSVSWCSPSKGPANFYQDTVAAQRCQRAAVGSNSAWGIEAAPKLSKPEIQRLLRETANLIRTAHILVSADPAGFNAAFAIWKSIAVIPPAERHQLLDILTSDDIVRLWRYSAQRYTARPSEALAAVGLQYNMLDDFPEKQGEVFTYDGRAALQNGLRLKLVDRFQKVFFTGDDPEELYGRVLLGIGPLVNALYPLYYCVSLQPSIVPATNEISDVQLEYLDPEAIPLSREDIPRWVWPTPGPQRWPYSGGITDHMRAIGPGCWIGVGWKAPRPGVDVGRRFNTFLLVRRFDKEK